MLTKFQRFTTVHQQCHICQDCSVYMYLGTICFLSSAIVFFFKQITCPLVLPIDRNCITCCMCFIVLILSYTVSALSYCMQQVTTMTQRSFPLIKSLKPFLPCFLIKVQLKNSRKSMLENNSWIRAFNGSDKLPFALKFDGDHVLRNVVFFADIKNSLSSSFQGLFLLNAPPT